jgi:hypothetical protein
VILVAHDQETWLRDISVNELRSNAKEGIQFLLQIKPDEIPYTRKEVRLALSLTPADGGEACAIQQFELPIQISNTFRYNPNANVLLVTNINTPAGQVESWRERCNCLGLHMDIWNVSLNGHLELTGEHPQRNNGPSKLFELYSGKTIVM